MNGIFNGEGLHKLNEKTNGWLYVSLLILVEILVIYFISNMPFFLTTLETPPNSEDNVNFFLSFINVLSTEIEKGQLLTFVCALIAPVIFWCCAEFKKMLMAKILLFAAFTLLVFSAYLHGKGEDFIYFTSFDLYIGALIIWVVSIISHRFPPDNSTFLRDAKAQENHFINMTRSR